MELEPNGCLVRDFDSHVVVNPSAVAPSTMLLSTKGLSAHGKLSSKWSQHGDLMTANWGEAFIIMPLGEEGDIDEIDPECGRGPPPCASGCQDPTCNLCDPGGSSNLAL